MKKRELIKRGIAAGTTFVFMSVVRPNPAPSLIGAAFVAILMYEGLCVGLETVMQMKRNSDRYINATRAMQARREMRNVELQNFRRIS